MNTTTAASSRPLCFALQGGGSHGAFTWGVLDAFLEAGFSPEGISGTSAGGMNAVALAQGWAQGGSEGARTMLRKFWMTVAERGVPVPWFQKVMHDYSVQYIPFYHILKAITSYLSPYQFNPWNKNPFKELLEEIIDVDTINRQETIQLFLAATQVATGKIKIFRNSEITVDVLLASACMPFLFHAVKVGEYDYWDGGFVANPAIYPLIYNCTSPDIVVVQLTPLRHYTLPTTLAEISGRLETITFNACLMREMRSMAFISKLIDDGLLDSSKIRRVYVHVVRNEQLFRELSRYSSCNNDRDFLLFLFEEGRKTAVSWLKNHQQDLGVRTTEDLEEDFV